ncbi:MAG TPA: serine hydrolase domain-containing protein [Thermohalobaculum sp.]|nr:serine hydrolase domain-containing protein [Thermohalobaculum sp.]
MLKTVATVFSETDQPQTSGFDPARLARIRSWMQGYVDTQKFPGALTLIARRGTVVYCDWVGLRDVERGLPWQRDTLARFYSMTKPITSTALMMLYEQGLCHLDDPVDIFLPELADRRVLRPGAKSLYEVDPAQTRMTLHHLLTHTSGMTYGFNDGLLAEAYVQNGVNFSDKTGDLADSVTRLAAMPLAFDPGSRWNYSISTDVLGRIVEVISGQPLDVFFNDHILGPLGMDDTFFEVPDSHLDRLASSYTKAPTSGMTLVEDAPGSAFRQGKVRQISGGGGLVSTVDDYLRFAEMQRRGGALGDVRLLGPRTMRLMTSNHLPGDLASMGQKVFSEVPFDGIGFGLGGSVMLDPAKAKTLGNPGDFGWGGMASTVYWVDPAEDMVVIFVTQLMPSSSYPNRKELRALVYSALVD